MVIRPLTIPTYVRVHQEEAQWFLNNVHSIRENILRISSENPEVTIVVPAFNEEDSILRCLSSLSKTITSRKIEILVVNNNSSDRTQEFIEKSGAKFVIEYKQGVKHARNAGLAFAKGKIILNADADSVYSPYWVDLLSAPLEDTNVSCSFGSFAFLPDRQTFRLSYFLYETAGDIYKQVNQIGKDSAMYVYGCSSAFRKDQGVDVGCYEHPEGANEDGYLALKLRNKFGKLHHVNDSRSLVWTSDRRLREKGGLLQSFMSRMSQIFKKL
jgi:glycosyltransferase involved in cell wall biosynthesis